MTDCHYLTPTKSLHSTNQIIVRIAVPTPLRRSFDYLIPQNLAPAPGCRVAISFGRRKCIGIVLEVDVETECKITQLKEVDELIDATPILPPKLIELLTWASRYYHHPIGEVLDAALPSLLRQGRPLQDFLPTQWQLTYLGQTMDWQTLSRAPKQQQILSFLTTAKTPTEIQQADLSNSALKTLQAKNWIEQVSVPFRISDGILKQPLNQLNSEQQQATQTITASLGSFQVFALEGVTGSGKTIVYQHAIEQCLRQGKQTVVLVPEIGLTPQTMRRFTDQFDTSIVVMHSNLTATERASAWVQAQQGEAKIILGTRSAVFVPLKNPGLFIVDEEHDLSYKQQDHFRYSARDILIRRAQIESCPIVLGSATLSLETFHNVKQHRFQHLQLTQRYGSTMPTIELMDTRHRQLTDGMSSQLIEAIKQELTNNKQVMIFINRRGFAPVLFCHQCNWQQVCPNCDSKMIVHLTSNRLNCHHCETWCPIPQQCPSCENTELLPVGVGTQRVETCLRALLPQARIARIDRDTTQKKQQLNNLLDQIHAGEIDIVIGTQMVAKGHHFSKLSLVAILDIDAALYSTDFRAPERIAQLITQVAGRAGRESNYGKVVIQSSLPDHPKLMHFLEKGYSSFLAEELAEREIAALPPYQYQALFRASSTKPMQAVHILKQALNHTPLDPHVLILGPTSAPMEKKQNRYRAQLILQAANRRLLHQVVNKFITQCEHFAKHSLRWSVDIDPLDIF